MKLADNLSFCAEAGKIFLESLHIMSIKAQKSTKNHRNFNGKNDLIQKSHLHCRNN